MGQIRNLKGLAEYLGVDPHQTGLEDKVGRRLYKDTACGVTFWVTTTVHVAGYAEGYDGELPAHSLSFPFTPDEFSDIVANADIEGCQMFDEIHGEGDD